MSKRIKGKFSITLPPEMSDILDSFCKYHSMNRSAAIAYLLAKGLCMESNETNGFDFDTPYAIATGEDGKDIILKRSECVPKTFSWTYAIGKNNQGKYISVSSSDFSDDDISEE